jgi:predicted DNA-binding transcriptional regulator AlpA
MSQIVGVLSTKQVSQVLGVSDPRKLEVPAYVRRQKVGSAWAWREPDVRLWARARKGKQNG